MIRGLCQRISLWRFVGCQGEIIRQICHLSSADLKEVEARNRMRNGKPDCFVANKYDANIDTNAIICSARKIYDQMQHSEP